MARKRRTTNKNNIVIVCEGTDTEYKYLSDLKEYIKRILPGRFSDIRIVPTTEELLTCINRNKNKKLKNIHPWAYYIQEEDNQKDFDTYRAQPIRYVREAELFTINDGYEEAWAVYDHDDFAHHEFAKSHADAVNVNIAFSSISFEEWFLLHFERNDKAFSKSVCKKNKEDIMCGTGEHQSDCHGDICVGGRIRENKYIPDYGKSMNGLFMQLFDKHKVAIVNAAWSRALHHNPMDFWRFNPLTTVDRLISRLLGYDQEYAWIHDTRNFTIDRTQLKLLQDTITNIGHNPIILNYIVYDNRMEMISEHKTEIITPNSSIQLQIHADGRFIGIVDNKDIKITTI
ncbi:MAG: RloB family protein [Muribaculaceae bacterium]|nr:RloB family protein [Muribaculaceae bacterium]